MNRMSRPHLLCFRQQMNTERDLLCTLMRVRCENRAIYKGRGKRSVMEDCDLMNDRLHAKKWKSKTNFAS